VKRKATKTWAQHEAELADNYRALNNTASLFTGPWPTCDEEDLALRRLPMKLRQYLTSESMCPMPPSEVLSNHLHHGNMLLTLVRINIAMTLAYYGEQHPSINKLSRLCNQLERKASER
jgi:hypothetical protein